MKYNQKMTVRRSIESRSDTTSNYEGGVAFTMSPKLELYQRVATWLVNEPKFYGDTDSETGKIIRLMEDISEHDPEFILKLAYYSRRTLHLRTAPTFMLVVASLIDKCKPFVRTYTPLILSRADQMAESLAILKTFIGDIGDGQKKGSVPSSLKKGISDALVGFEEYDFAKYDRDAEFKLRDVLRLVHPKPGNKKQSKLFKSILDGTLKPADTWEVIISTKGSTKENWNKSIPKMGYMALLRNGNNFLKVGADIKKVIKRLTDEESVKKSKQLPFRFLSAYNAIKGNPSPFTVNLLDAVTEAMDISVDNLPKLGGVTAIFSDHSGSMNSKVSNNSEILRSQVADTMLAISHKLSDTPITGCFGTNLNIINITKRGTLLSVINELGAVNVGGSTHTYLTVKYLLDKKIKVDRIIICTDEQGYGYGLYELLVEYRAKINPKVYTYVINLAGYGTSEIPENDRYSIMLAGFSDRIFEFIGAFEEEKTKAINKIESISISC